MKLALLIEYHGAEFSGWQFQPNLRTVEAELTTALTTGLSAYGKRRGEHFAAVPTLSCSGRTDSGVHAKGQVVSFRWPSQLTFDRTQFLALLNGILPPDLCVRDAVLAAIDFDARKSRHVKCYRYYFDCRPQRSPLLRDRAWHVASPLDFGAMESAAAQFQGRHDFRNFCSAASHAASSERSLAESKFSAVGKGLYVYEAIAAGFLKNMVRIIAASLVDVGSGRLSLMDAASLLREDPSVLRRTLKAPAHGLLLEWVCYDDFPLFSRSFDNLA